MPRSIQDLIKKHKFNESQERLLENSREEIAIHLSKTSNEIKQAVRNQIKNGLDENKTSTQIASDLFWQIEDGANNQYTADRIEKNWKRIAVTEIQSVYEAGILSEHEDDAVLSLKDSSKAQYFVFTGGTCSWCVPRHGTLVRLLPKSMIKDTGNDSLSSMGINDPNTDIAVWVGKNNVGYKKNQWRICTPAHPYNAATLQPIDIVNDYYDIKDSRIKKRQKEQKYIPQQKRVENKPKHRKLDNGVVEYNDNIYEAVAHSDYEKKFESWKKTRTGAIPVDMDSTDYKRIFNEAI